jgi:hypothetical protein
LKGRYDKTLMKKSIIRPRPESKALCQADGITFLLQQKDRREERQEEKKRKKKRDKKNAPSDM